MKSPFALFTCYQLNEQSGKMDFIVQGKCLFKNNQIWRLSGEEKVEKGWKMKVNKFGLDEKRVGVGPTKEVDKIGFSEMGGGLGGASAPPPWIGHWTTV